MATSETNNQTGKEGTAMLPKELPAGHEYLVMGAHSWGRGKTVDAAKKECRRHWSISYEGKFVKKNYRIYIARAGAHVNDWGNICWSTKESGHIETACPLCYFGEPAKKGG